MNGRLWLAVIAAATVYFGAVPEADNDLWMHLFVGRWILEHGAIPRVDTLSYTASGAPWVDHEWLWQVLAFMGFRLGGSSLLLLVKLGLVAGSVALLARGAQTLWELQPACGTRQLGPLSPWVLGFVLLVAIPVLGRGWAVRPQLASYLLLPVLFGALARWELGGRRALVWALLPVTFTCWANLHGGFVLGVAVLLPFAASGLGLGREEFVQRCGLVVLCLAATGVNPYGPGLYLYLADELGRPHPITEWQPLTFDWEHGPFLFFASAVVVTLPWLPWTWSNGWRAIVALAVLYFAWQHQRHTPVFVLCAASLLVVQWQRLVWWLQDRGVHFSTSAQRFLMIGVALVATVQAVLAGAHLLDSRGRLVFRTEEYPVGAVSALQAGGAQGNLAVPLDWGGYVLWHLAPRVRPSLDGRFATVYPRQVVADNFAFFRAEGSWRRLLEGYPTQAVLLPAGLVHPIEREPDWRAVYRDRVATLWVQERYLNQFALGAAATPVSPKSFFP